MSDWAGASESGIYAPHLFRGLIPAASPSRGIGRVTEQLQKRCVITDARPRAEFVIQQPPEESQQFHRQSNGPILPTVISNRPATAQPSRSLNVSTPQELTQHHENDILQRTVERLGTPPKSDLSLADLAMEFSRLDTLMAPLLRSVETSSPKESKALAMIWQRVCNMSRVAIEAHFLKFETMAHDFQHSEAQNKKMKRELTSAIEELKLIRSKDRENAAQHEKMRIEFKRAKGEAERLRSLLFAKGDDAAENIMFLKLAHQKIMNEVGIEDFEQEKLIDEIGDLQQQIKKEVAHEREEFTKVIDGKAALRLDAEVSRRFKAYVRQKEGEMPSADLLNMKTPRPLWEKLLKQNCPHVSIGGDSSHDKVAYLSSLVGRLVPKPLPPKEKRVIDGVALTDYGVALGTGPDVPQWLRWGGKVKLYGITKIETEKYVREVWAAKKQDDKAMLAREKPIKKIFDFMHLWLQKKVGNFSAIMADLAYNFMDGLQRFQEDADIELFFRIVTKRLDESVYYDQTAFLQKVLIDMQGLDYKENNGKLLGVIAIARFNYHLTAMFKFKSASRIAKVLASAKEMHPGGHPVDNGGIRYEILFSEDRELNQGPFAECLRDQYLQERQEWIDEMDLKLQSLTVVSADSSVVTKAQVVEAIKDVDKGKSKKEIEEILTVGFALANTAAATKLKNDVTVKIDVFISRISKMVIRWTSISQRALAEDANERMKEALADAQKSFLDSQKAQNSAMQAKSKNADAEDVEGDAEGDQVLLQENYTQYTKNVRKQ